MTTFAQAARRSAALAWGAAVAVALLLLAEYLGIALLRMPYPYHLEWMEGGSLDHARWILSGHPLYRKPSLEFTPYAYPPLYFYASAAAMALLGDGFLALRLVSFLASLGCFALLFLWLKRETSDPRAALLAACLFAAAFPLSGAWFDVARVDSLMLALLLAGAATVRFGTTTRSAVGAALLLALAALTKQTALGLVPPLALAALVLKPRWGAAFLGSFAALGAASFLALDALHDGWFRFYILDLPAQHTYYDLSIGQYFALDLLPELSLAAAAAFGYLVFLAWQRRGRDALFYSLLAAGLIGSSYLSRLKVGSFANASMPAFAALALLAALAFHEARARLASGAGRGLAGAAAGLALLAQLLFLAYDPRPHLPTTADREAGDRLVREIRSQPGDVLVPELSYLAATAGKRIHAQSQAASDVLRAQDARVAADLLGEIRAAVGDKRYAAVYVFFESWTREEWLGRELAAYRRSVVSFPDSQVFLPRTGFKLRPRIVFTPGGTDQGLGG
jgi:hypothetical protein